LLIPAKACRRLFAATSAMATTINAKVKAASRKNFHVIKNANRLEDGFNEALPISALLVGFRIRNLDLSFEL
jgi:hypothetical protein